MKIKLQYVYVITKPDLLTCVDVAMVLSNGKVIAKGTPSELVNNQSAKTAYFGDSN